MNRLSQLHLPLDLSHTRIRDVALALLGGNTKHPGFSYLAALIFMIQRRNKMTRPLLTYWQAARQWSTDPYWATSMFEQIRDLARSGADRTTVPLMEECSEALDWVAHAQRTAAVNKGMLSTVDQVLETVFHLPDEHEQVVVLHLELHEILDAHQRETSATESGAPAGGTLGITPEQFMQHVFRMGGMVPLMLPGTNLRPRREATRSGQVALIPATPVKGHDGPRARLYDPEDARNWLKRSPSVKGGLIPDENAKLRRLMEDLANGDPTRPLAQIPGTQWGRPLASVEGGTMLALPAPAAEPVAEPAAAPAGKSKRKPKSAAAKARESDEHAAVTPARQSLDFLQAEQARTRGPLAHMYTKFPHFHEVLDFVSRSLALAACGTETATVKFPPILLRGEPGTGKTYFAQMLAEALGTPFHERDLSISTEAFVLSGMDSGWKNSRPGLVFEAIARGAAANPLILLNEVDKAAVSGTHNSPIAPMYSLLEPTSACKFVDEFASLPIDASHVLWVLTANDGHIPAPILSRLEVFDVKTPTPEECRLIAESVWEGVLKREMPRGHGFPEKLPEDVLDAMSRLSPRVMRKRLRDIASEAAFNGRSAPTAADLTKGEKRYAPAGGSKIGFVKD